MDTMIGSDLFLRLHVCDPAVVDYLQSFGPADRDDKALEALKVGVIALRSVTPVLDASIVDQKFQNLEARLEGYAHEFAADLQAKLDQYFRSETGTVPRQLDSLVGDNGSLSKVFEDYFGMEHGRLSKLVRDQIGPESDFGKTIDPGNSLGLLQRIERTVDAKLREASDNVLVQFSLDKGDSAVSRLQNAVAIQIEQIKLENGRFFAELKEHFGIERGREEEAVKGTQKGRDFESDVYDYLADICRSAGDLSENLTSVPGNIARCKTGDYVSTLGSDSGAGGKKIVIEAKKKDGYTLRSALEELKEAKANRDAAVAIIVFSQECCPVEVGAFRIVDHDLIISIDLEDETQVRFYLESAYRIARAMVVAARSQELSSQVDVNRIAGAIRRIERVCERFTEIHKKASSIKQSAAAVEELADGIRPEIEHNLREIELLARAGSAEQTDSAEVGSCNGVACAEANGSLP